MTSNKRNQDIDSFLLIVRLMKEHGINFWIDQGSLLGIIRTGNLFSWDHDIDISIWNQEKAKMEAIVIQFQKLGYRVRLLPYVLKLGIIDCRIYYDTDGYANTELRSNSDQAILKSYTRRIRKLLSILLYIRNNSVRLMMVGVAVPKPDQALKPRRYQAALWINNRTRWVDSALDYFRDRRVLFRVNRNFLNKLETIEAYDELLPVPADAENYLCFKYGDSWRVPNKDWVYWRDDGALLTVRYHDLSFLSVLREKVLKVRK